ncbi:MAG: SpoVR family protein [Polyangiaceae bacterium]|nr:SpoVR family protein [Polyangiaceae bacterium]
MSTNFAEKTQLPSYLRAEQEKIERVAREAGLDFFPTVFEMLAYDQMNEIAAYTGFPTRYPHWRFGMEYERLSKTYEYGLSKIYELVINNNPSYAYLLEGNSLTEQKLVMCHVLGHVDFFKNNFAFRSTDLDGGQGARDPMRRQEPFEPPRKWIDKMANNGQRVRRHMDRHGQAKVEEYLDHCLSLENLIDPFHAPAPRRRPWTEEDDEPEAVEVPRLPAKSYMEKYINPEDALARERERLEAREQAPKTVPERPERDVLRFLLDHAPLERWERDCLEVVREEAYYFLPQMQTKIMNEGWASYWHSRMMTEKIADATDILDYADRNAGVMATSGGRLNPYKLGVELFRDIEDRWNKGRFGKAWDDCDDQEERGHWDMRLGGGRAKIFEVRRLYTDLTFIDEFLTFELAERLQLFTVGYSGRNERWEIESREFAKVKEGLLRQLSNGGSPVILVVDSNFDNRGELLLRHEHEGVDLRVDWARECLRSLTRIWRRPCNVATVVEGKPTLLRFDGVEHGARGYKV